MEGKKPKSSKPNSIPMRLIPYTTLNFIPLNFNVYLLSVKEDYMIQKNKLGNLSHEKPGWGIDKKQTTKRVETWWEVLKFRVGDGNKLKVGCCTLSLRQGFIL